MEARVPKDIDLDACWGGAYLSWTNSGSGGRYQQGPSQIDRLWILDVERARLVIGASWFPATSSGNRAELLRIAGSVDIQP
jgi:hypothetical protein